MTDHMSTEFWLKCMGKSLPRAVAQPVQPMRVIEGTGSLHPHVVHGKLPKGAEVGLRLDGRRIVLEATADSGSSVPTARFYDDRDESLVLSVPDDVRQRLPVNEPCWTMLVSTENRLELMPIRVEEHQADTLGPRSFDEVCFSEERNTPEVVRHVVKGLEHAEWTADRIMELENLLCAKPFARDPVPELATGNDWVAWKARREIMAKPTPDDRALHLHLIKDVFDGQQEDGSWEGSVAKTGYGILQALAIRVPRDDPRILKAAEWLLERSQPERRPGMWMAREQQLNTWNRRDNTKTSWTEPDFDSFEGGLGVAHEREFVMQEAGQRVIPTCARGYSGLCDAMMHISAIAADALCQCGHADHPRVKDYFHSMTQLAAMFGYFYSCWGILDFHRGLEERGDAEPDFDLPERKEEYDIALRAIPYGYGRDADDLLFLAGCPQAAGVHRPDLADTNGWFPYTWHEIGVENHYALIGAYWQNADCWARSNRALAQYPGCVGSLTEFFALFQCHLYQTSLGEWSQGTPGGILRFITETTRLARTRDRVDASPLLRFAKLMVLRTVPWLREHQKKDGLWHHEDLPRWGDAVGYPAMGPRLGTYHILTALHAFGLLGRLRP